MRLLENDVAIITIVTLLLFSMVRSLDAAGNSSPVVESPPGDAVEWVVP